MLKKEEPLSRINASTFMPHSFYPAADKVPSEKKKPRKSHVTFFFSFKSGRDDFITGYDANISQVMLHGTDYKK